MTAAAPQPPPPLLLDVEGMKCAGCAAAVEKRLRQQPGVANVSVSLLLKLALVEPGETTPAADALAASVTAIGFACQPRDPAAQAAPLPAPADTPARAWDLSLAVLLLGLSLAGHSEGLAVTPLGSLPAHALLATLALVGPGRSLLVNGWQGLRHGAPNMNSLIGLGTGSAYVASLVAWGLPGLGWDCFFDEPVMLLAVVLLGRTLEQRAEDRASQALRGLLERLPDQATLALPREGQPPDPDQLRSRRRIDSRQLRPGDWVLVAVGDRIPVDGEILVGQSELDESMLTGESLPVRRGVGEWVQAGTINLGDRLLLRTEASGARTRVGRMAALVAEAQLRKAPIQTLADRVSGWFCYAILVLALVTGAAWWWLGLAPDPAWMVSAHHAGAMPGPGLFALQRAIAVLVVACPCALGLATPTALLVASGRAAEAGLLVRGGDVLERCAAVTTVVFDKTGTLTTGQLQPVHGWTAEHVSSAQLLEPLAALTVDDRHPVARALAALATADAAPAVGDRHREPGCGVTVQLDGCTYRLGRADWLAGQGLPLPSTWEGEAHRWAAEGSTLVWLADDGQILGGWALADRLRPDAIATLRELNCQGLEVWMLTGDQPGTAQAIATQLGLPAERVLAARTPEAKADWLAAQQQQGALVAMVGDGLNDAPALVGADVSISLQSAQDLAREGADVLLLADRLELLPQLFSLARHTLATIRLNLAWAFSYNLVALPLAAGLLLPLTGRTLTPTTAAALMAGSSLAVVLNSLRLRLTPSGPARPGSVPHPAPAPQ